MIKMIKYEDVTVEYEDSFFGSWKFMKELSSGINTFGALDKLLCGKSDEIAEALDDSMEKMNDLLERISLIEGKSKN